MTNGVLRINASSRKTARLFFVGDRKAGFVPFTDFELEAEVRASPNSNGGIFVHTDTTTRDAQKHLARGYEVQLNSSKNSNRGKRGQVLWQRSISRYDGRYRPPKDPWCDRPGSLPYHVPAPCLRLGPARARFSAARAGENPHIPAHSSVHRHSYIMPIWGFTTDHPISEP